MTHILEKLKAGIETGTTDELLLREVLQEFAELTERENELEELLLMLVRTGWPWDDEGTPNDILRASRDGYAGAMVRARDLLGLDRLSRITRTEPRT